MIRLALRFGSGRYHATPWMHNVNEGVPEWPPSPWRLLRAAAAVLHTRAEGIPVDLAWNALLRLDVPPAFTLPPAAPGHTRHYLSRNETERTASDLVIDSFVAVDRDARLVVHWPVELAPAELDALARVFARLPYLGRAESWCDAEVLPAGADAPEPDCRPGDGTATQGHEVVRVLCPAAGVGRVDLERTTSMLQREGWPDPPGSRWVLYRRAANALSAAPRPIVRRERERSSPTVAELVLGGSVLPLVTEGVRFAARVRRALLALHVAPSRSFSGKSEDGEPLAEQHAHAHFVPQARDQRRPNRVTHLVVFCPAGLTEQEADAVLRLGTIRAEDETKTDVYASCSGFGTPEDFARTEPSMGEATRWRSSTPMVLPRHPKRSWRDSIDGQVTRELGLRGYPAPAAISLLAPGARLDGRHRVADFDLRRTPRDPWPTTPALGLEIEFSEAVAGPLLIGLASHYGLGQFVPAAVDPGKNESADRRGGA